jgi:hypothetical protein
MAQVHFKPYERSGSSNQFGDADGFFPSQYAAPSSQVAGGTPPPSSPFGGSLGGTSSVAVNRSNSAQNQSTANTGYNSLSGSAGNGGGGDFQSDQQRAPDYRTRFGDPADDLPLLEELGIFPRHIWNKANAVLHPLKPMNADVIEDTDVAGPIVFAVGLAFLFSLQGKVQFGAIYGLSLLGIIFAKVLLSLMTEQSVPTQFVVSTLGYCLLPNLILAVIQTFQYWLIGSHTILIPMAFAVIGWSAWCATNMFVRALAMDAQKFLILYPLVIFYAVFASLTIF